MSKFLLNLPLQIFKALVNSKIQFLIQKSFSFLSALPTLRPIWPMAQPAHQPRHPPQAKIAPTGPSSPRIGHVFTGNTFSFSVHAFPCRPPLPRLSVNRAPSVRCVFPTTPADPSHFLPSPPATPRRPTSDLAMPDKTITPLLDSPP
jgi:hypothetical protein